ncbi:MAG: PQQ-like beta-propeller repeat protein [Candidatus Marinimicrobia bacterium]|nr:PQQ-like beta-propeller repeat protein [Candidatus Neomarinimicrobiota bacterium]
MNRPVALACYFIIALIFLSAACEKNPTDGDDNGIPTTMPQEHIPWPSLADSPWPMYRHDPQGTGRSQYVGPQLGEIVFTFGDTIHVWGSVVIGNNGTLYFVSSDNLETRLYAVNPSGQLLWRTLIATSYGPMVENPVTPTVASNGIIYVSASDFHIGAHFGKIHAVRSDGSIDWTYEVDESVYSNIVLDLQGNLYFLTAESNKLISLTPGGTLRWELSVPDGFHNSHQAPVFSPDGSVMYTGGSDSLYAITTDGEILWGYHTFSFFHSNLVDNDGNIYFYNPGDSCFTSLNSAGEINWRTHIDTLNLLRVPETLAHTLDLDGNIYFIGVNNYSKGEIISLRGIDGSIRWKLIVNGLQTDLVSDGSSIYVGGVLTISCISTEGQILWQVEPPQGAYHIYNGPAIDSDGICYFPVLWSPVIQVIGVR